MFGEGQFKGGVDQDGSRAIGGDAASAGNGLDARVGVLEGGGGVAVQGQRAFPGKDVVADAVFGEVGVFHGADADVVADLAKLVVGEGFGVGVAALFGFDEAFGVLGFGEFVAA